jgi:RNA polymerase sigma-70 factor (ECF subfamily)
VLTGPPIVTIGRSVNQRGRKRNRKPMDDVELIARLADGDDAALRELFFRHAPWLAARLRAVLPAADVEDVLQETFLAAWRGARGYRPEGAVGGWLWGIGRRRAALWLRRRGPAALPLPAAEPAGGQHAGDPAEAALWRADLAAAVEALGPEGGAEREVWRLMYVEDRPVAEVAKLTGVPDGTVKSRASRARRLLRAALRSTKPALRSSKPALRSSQSALRSSQSALRSSKPALRSSKPALRSSQSAPRGSKSALRGRRSAPRGSKSALRGRRPAVMARSARN